MRGPGMRHKRVTERRQKGKIKRSNIHLRKEKV